MTPSELVEAVEEAGGTLELHGEKVRYQMPPTATHLLEPLRQQREAVKALLLERRIMAVLPTGVRLVSWQPATPPVALTRHSILNDVDKFIAATLQQLGHALDAQRNCYFCRLLRGEPKYRQTTPEEVIAHRQHENLGGNWSTRDLLERLEQVGLKLEVCDTA